MVNLLSQTPQPCPSPLHASRWPTPQLVPHFTPAPLLRPCWQAWGGVRSVLASLLKQPAVQQVFGVPVNIQAYPDYLATVAQPMDLGTIQSEHSPDGLCCEVAAHLVGAGMVHATISCCLAGACKARRCT